MSSPSRSASAAQRRLRSREARDAFPPMGVYAIRDLATGRVRVAASRNVVGALNRVRFELRLGSHPDKSWQAAWDAGTAERFSFEVVELVKQRDDPAFDYGAELRALEELHREELEGKGAQP